MSSAAFEMHFTNMISLIIAAIIYFLVRSSIKTAAGTFAYLATATCAIPFAPTLLSFCPTKVPNQVIATAGRGPPFWSTAICHAFPSTEYCVSNVSNDQPQSPSSIQTAVVHHLKEANTIIESSYQLNDNLSRSIQQVLLGVNHVNALIKTTDLPPHAKATVFKLLKSVRASARQTNECVQHYKAGLTNGVDYVLASASHTANSKSTRSPTNSAGDIITTTPQDSGRDRVSFIATMKAFTGFTSQLAEKNEQCRESILQLESKLDNMVNTFVDDAFSAAKGALDEANAHYWAFSGRGKARSMRAKENINSVHKVGHGIERLSAFTVILDFHLQELRARAIELAGHAELLSESDLPIEDIMGLIKSGCLSLRQTYAGGDQSSLINDRDRTGIQATSS